MDPQRLADIVPPADVDFDSVIDAILDDLPDAFLERLGSVAIVVEDEASPDQLAAVGAGGLFGLYQGVPRTRFGVDNVPLPSKITLFRGPLTRANPRRSDSSARSRTPCSTRSPTTSGSTTIGSTSSEPRAGRAGSRADHRDGRPRLTAQHGGACRAVCRGPPISP